MFSAVGAAQLGLRKFVGLPVGVYYQVEDPLKISLLIVILRESLRPVVLYLQ